MTSRQPHRAARPGFAPGITSLLERRSDWIRGVRIGLVSHPAAVDAAGASSAALLLRARGVRVTALFGPEHGFFGGAPAGQSVRSSVYPGSSLRVHSLYGERRRPASSMLRGVDVLVVDLQDLAARCYTYVSTLRLVLEAAAAAGKAVIVADRPVPLPNTAEGPRIKPGFESFVAAVNVPMLYGLTPGEAAVWIKRDLGLDVNLRIARLRGYRRESRRGPGWPPWIPPSPGIASWESAWCYTATVFCEAFPALDHGRRAGLPFQLLGAPWLRGREMSERMDCFRLPGLVFHSHPYLAESPAFSRRLVDGLRLTVTDPDAVRPVTAGVCLMSALRELYGPNRVWTSPGVRPAWIDRLYGTDQVRKALMDGEPPLRIARQWDRTGREYARSRNAVLLYRSA